MIYFQADVIVNSADPELNLRKGRASKALLDAAGETIQDECNTGYPFGIESGEVAVTGSGNLKCRAIYHVTLPKWNNQGDEKVGCFFVALLFAPHHRLNRKIKDE